MEEEKLLKRKKRAKGEHNSELLASTLKKLGELYHSQKQYEAALEAYEEERELWTIIGKPMQAAIANRMMGEIYCYLGEYKDALRNLKKYFDVATAENNLIEEQRALATIGRTYFCMSESVTPSNEAEYKRALREAKQAYMLSLKVCDRINNIDRYELLQMRSRLMLNMGLVFECQGDIDKAVEHIDKAITINRRADLYEDTFRCYSSMAALYQRRGNFVLSLKYHDLALEVAERLPDKTQLMCETLSSKADVYLSVTNYRAAKQTLTKAYRMCSGSLENKSLIEKNLKIAHVLCESEEKLMNMSDNDQNTMKQLYEAMGDACCVVKNFDQAVTYYQKMLECCETLGYCGKELLPALISLSQTYKDAGKYEESLKFLQKELDIWDDNPVEACKTSLNIVQVLEQKESNYSIIIENLKKAHEYSLIANNEKLEVKVLQNMMSVQEKYGFTEEANETRSKMDIIKTDISSLESSSDMSDDNDEVETPELINNVSLSDILEEPAPSNVESPQPRQVRRQPQGVKIRRNEKGETQLQAACILGKFQRVKQLIDLKHPVNVTDNGGWTPLHEVCNHGHEDLVELLLDNGANINDSGGDGCEGVTPLHDACSNGHLKIVQILLDRGACIDVRTNANKTPLNFLMEWAAGAGSLSQDNTGLFECIKERLQRGLEKAGVSTESVNVPLVQHSTGKRKITQKSRPKQINQSSKKEFEGKRWSLVRSESSCSGSDSEEERTRDPPDHDDGNKSANECEDYNSDCGSLVFSPALIVEDPALEYQKVMKGLRKKVVQEPSTKRDKMTKIGAFIGDRDVVDDWLIDDMKDQIRPNKRRKIRDEDKGGAKLIGTLRKDVQILGEDTLENHGPDLMEIEETPSDSEEIVQPFNQYSIQQSSDKKRACPQQTSLLDSGFCISEKTAHRSDTPQHFQENEMCIPTVKVHIENTSLVVPMSTSESSVPLTIDWLAKEAAKRFLKLEGKEPTLVLLTNDGATLAADDPITVIYNRELIAQVTGWKTVSLMQRYIDVCTASDTECLLHIKNCLQECDVTHCINLSNCGLYLDSLTPFIQSLQYEHSLKELLLGGNALMDDGIQMFSTIKGLPLLEILDLSCNNITSLGLSTLCSFLSHCQSLKVLDLSYNDFEDGWLESVHRITEDLNTLVSLSLRSCGLVGDEFISWERNKSVLSNIRFLEVLDVSYNPLGDRGINGFLYHLNTMNIRKLSVAGTALANSRSMPTILEFFQKTYPTNLRFLDLSDCFITDSELMDLLRYLTTAEDLATLLLRNNSSLSVLSLKALMSMQNVPDSLDLCGCDSLFSSCGEEHGSHSFSDEFLKKLSSLCITCNTTELSHTTVCWSDEVKDRWKQIWGDRAKVWSGPSGLLNLDIIKIEEG